MPLALRICVVASYPPNIGGEAAYAHNYVTALEKYLTDQISEIYILSHREGEEGYRDPPTHDNGKVRVYRLFNSYNIRTKHLAFLKIFNAIRSIRPDLVHFQYSPIPKGKYGGLIGEPLLILFLLLKLIKIPFFVSLHSIWLPEEAEARLFELTKNRILARFALHYFKIFTYFLATMPEMLFLLVPRRDSTIIKRFSKTYHIPLSHLREELHGIWWNDSKIDTVPKKRSQSVVCLGVIRPSKGYEDTLKAMQTVVEKLPHSSLIIAGTAISDEGRDYIANLRALIKEYSLGNSAQIEEKYLSDNEFSEYVRAAGVIVLPYTRVVGASSILSYALSYRIPVILADSAPFFAKLSDIIPVISTHDHMALANEIIKVLDSEEYQAALVKRYGEYALEHDWSVLVRNIYAEYSRASHRK